MGKKPKHKTEVTAFINDENNCDVLMSGTPDDLLDCICAIIKSLAIRLTEEPDMIELQKEMNVPDDMLQSYLITMLMGEMMDILGDVTPIIAKFEVDPEVDGNTTIEELINRFTNSSINHSETNEPEELIPEDAANSLDFDGFSSEEDSTDE
jgi:hypothetical protein